MDEDELYNLFEDTMKEFNKQFLPNEETTNRRKRK